MLPDLQVIFFIVNLIVKSLEEIFICYLALGYIIIYYTIRISNTLEKVTSCMKFRAVEGWLI